MICGNGDGEDGIGTYDVVEGCLHLVLVRDVEGALLENDVAVLGKDVGCLRA